MMNGRIKRGLECGGGEEEWEDKNMSRKSMRKRRSTGRRITRIKRRSRRRGGWINGDGRS